MNAHLGFELNIATLYVVCLVDVIQFRANVMTAEKYTVLPELSKWAQEMNHRYPCLAVTKPYVA